MLASPRYEGPAIIAMAGEPGDQLAPFTRQRRRLQATLEALDPDDWSSPSRCQQWSVQDVVAHLVGVNVFWRASVEAGLVGAPTRVLADFDPAVTPALLVEPMRALAPEDVLQQFVAANDSLLALLETLDDRQWLTAAETPAGHVAIRVLAHHGLWDCWVHERDIALPLGWTPPVEVDELLSSLRYVSALGPAFALSSGRTFADVFAVEADDPDDSFVLEVGDCVTVRNRDDRDRDDRDRDDRDRDDRDRDDRDRAAKQLDDAVCLRGEALALVEALSLRRPLPVSAPRSWRELLRGLATAFDVDMPVGSSGPDRPTMQASEIPRALAAALSTAGVLGLAADEAVILHDSNRLALRLSPCDILARVAHASHAAAALEVELAHRLVATRCPVAPLDPRVEPHLYRSDGFVVSLWTYYEALTDRELPAADYAAALERLHDGMRTVDLTAPHLTPHFTDRVAEAQELVASAERTPALVPDDRELLSATLRSRRQAIEDGDGAEQLLHGEPHPGNVLRTKEGPLFVDLETCCRGPVEFDLAHLPEEASRRYRHADQELLTDCRVLVLAMVAAWRFDRADQFPNGQEAAGALLRALRRGPPWPTLDAVMGR